MKTTQVQLIMPAHVNSSNRLFGGQLMAWIDVVASVEARRHTRRPVITACVDHLDFLEAARLGELICLEASVTWTGRTSLEVLAESYVESMSGSRTLINRAYLVFVALDEGGEPTTFPAFVPETEEEKREWDAAVLRKEHRKALKKKNNC